jgi:putative restriction endonuclease
MDTQYWWVNHNLTFEQEIGGSYLWSPKREAARSNGRAGARSQFYDNMRRANPGDKVLSFARGRISFVGVVQDFAVTAPKPEEFLESGKRWANVGWLLPVAWVAADTPISPKQFIGEIASMLPEMYSPLVAATGNGSQKAYLAEISWALFHYIILKVSPLIASPVSASNIDSVSTTQSIVDRLDEAIEEAIAKDVSLSSTEKEQLTLARRGQDRFRKNVADVESGCRVTRIRNPILLVASHIKPWRLCVSPEERLTGYNGLLLAHHVDVLFDKGLISFTNDGDVLISPRLELSDLTKLGLDLVLQNNVGKFLPDQTTYLAFHRENVFLLDP